MQGLMVKERELETGSGCCRILWTMREVRCGCHSSGWTVRSTTTGTGEQKTLFYYTFNLKVILNIAAV